jgi:hypothetical protein
MKKSNKLLIGGFLTVLLFITAIHVSLYAKYKSGDYTIYNAEDDMSQLSMQQFPNILFVSVQNVPNAYVKFGAVAQMEKGAEDGLQYVRKGDTLQITGKETQQGFRSPASLYLPHNVTLSAYNSSLFFEPGVPSVQNNPVMFLQKSSAIFPGERGPLQLGHLRIIASDNSLVLFHDNTRVDHLDIQLSNSALESNQGNFSQLSIVTDSLSRISLPAKQLLKATIKTAGTE